MQLKKLVLVALPTVVAGMDFEHNPVSFLATETSTVSMADAMSSGVDDVDEPTTLNLGEISGDPEDVAKVSSTLNLAQPTEAPESATLLSAETQEKQEKAKSSVEQEKTTKVTKAVKPATETKAKKEPKIDIKFKMPFEMEPFGREDQAQELTQTSLIQGNKMIDQIQRAEVAEEKRSVFRALTRLRGAAITSFDGIARDQTGNIDTYTANNQYREANPITYLAHQEADVAKWAFPARDAD
eukprot:TRINITY_DN49872_c0_g1_i1.p1 TRINITY_DN49872_c0_g1~~TRINITY_DN49872_c0_g1_i1.p1  ORF type:complete len:241 (-),score=65.12 TRINITY_DN49872_c0_g1_i1:145-867(-)